MTGRPAGLIDTPALRDAAALVIARLRGDHEGTTTILDNCELRSVAAILAGMAAQAMAQLAGDDRARAAEVFESRLRDLGTP